MQAFSRAFLCSLLLPLCAAAVAQEAQPVKTPLRVLHSTREAHSLPPEEAARAYPVHFQAVVTYYDPYIDPRHGAIFVHDATGSILLETPKRPVLPLLPGTLLDVTGVTGAGDYAPIVDHAEVRILGQSRLPADAITAPLPLLQTPVMDGQWVETEGVVHSVRLSEGHATFEIATLDGKISAVALQEAGVNYNAFIDSTVRLRGNCAPQFNHKRQLVGVHIFFPTAREIVVVQAASGDPFAAPLRPINSMLRYTPGMTLARLVHVQGTVTLQWPGRMLCIQQASDGICIDTDQAGRVNPGDPVDVVGFPSVRDFKATMEDASFRLTSGAIARPAAKSITASQVLKEDHDGELVTLEGELIGQDRTTGDLTLMLRSQDLLFPAILPQSAGSYPLPWKEGSVLRLTGICNVQIDQQSTVMGEGLIRSKNVQLLLRSLDDVELVRTPSWWTPAHALESLAILTAFAFVALAWIVILRRQVSQRTHALRKSEERLRHLSQHDALTGLPNRSMLSDRLAVALQRAERFHETLGLLMIDVDQFKNVNDTWGHLVGDKLLCELAKRISHSVRLTDTVARIGGDEFVVLLPDLHVGDQAAAIASKVVSAVAKPFDIVPGDTPLSVTISVGVCTYPEAGAEMEQLLQNVDAAMYSVKARGKNGFEVYKPTEM